MNPVAVRASVGGSNTSTINIMPNQPLSAVFITVEANLTVANTSDDVMGLLALMRNVIFRWKGTAIWNVRGDDLYRMARVLGAWSCRLEAVSNAAASRRIISVCIPFGRNLWDPNECFPRVDKGTTELQIDWTATGAGYDTLKFSIEPLQLLDAVPKQFVRVTTISDTPAATGNKDYDLPRLYPLLGIGVVETNSEPTVALKDIESMKLLVNFVEYDYSLIQGNLARAMQWFRRPAGLDGSTFTHIENTAAAYAQFATTLSQRMLKSAEAEFMYLNFDATQDGQYIMDASKATDLKLRVNYNTAAAARFMPVEIWPATVIQTTP
jgi:hypothetical protein